jgi:hypothetical protein
MGADALVVAIPPEFDPQPSGCLTIIVIQHSAQPLATLDRSTAGEACLILYDQPVVQPLVVALAMIVLDKFVDGLP